MAALPSYYKKAVSYIAKNLPDYTKKDIKKVLKSLLKECENPMYDSHMFVDGICEDTVLECEKVNTILEIFMEGFYQNFETLRVNHQATYVSTPLHQHDFKDVENTPGTMKCECGMYIHNVITLTL